MEINRFKNYCFIKDVCTEGLLLFPFFLLLCDGFLFTYFLFNLISKLFRFYYTKIHVKFHYLKFLYCIVLYCFNELKKTQVKKIQNFI